MTEKVDGFNDKRHSCLRSTVEDAIKDMKAKERGELEAVYFLQ